MIIHFIGEKDIEQSEHKIEDENNTEPELKMCSIPITEVEIVPNFTKQPQQPLRQYNDRGQFEYGEYTLSDDDK